ncbi:ribonuclease H-like domain-containing protein [Tanacetum coccineum]
MSKCMTGQDKEEEEDALIDILKTMVEECMSIYKKAQIKAPSSRTSEIQGISFITEEEEEDSLETLPCQLPPKEMNPGSFTLPCTISNLKLYAMADLGAGVNVMPKSLFEHLKLADLKETNMVVEMAEMTKKAPLAIMENILVKLDKFLFHSDFVVIDMLKGLNETMLLGRPFLETIHAQIDVFRREISLGIGTPSCSDESIDTVDSSDDMYELEGNQDDEVGSHLLENVVSKWHFRKPVRITFVDCEKDCGQWPTCNPDLSFCSGYDAIYKREESGMLNKIREQNIDDVTRERRYYKWVAHNYDFNVKSRRATEYADPYDFCWELNSLDLVLPSQSKKQSRRTLFTKEMDLETTQTNAAAKLPLLKQENGNSFKPTTRTTTNADGTSTLMIPGPKDAKTLFAAIQTRFGGNDATKKTQKTLLKQSYENLNAPSTKSLDYIFNRLQKIVSQNKPDLETMSFDDLYNNFNIVEQEVKRTGTSSLNSRSQNMAFVSTPGSTNEANTVNVQASTANSSVNTDSTLDSTANLSDATVYDFLANQPNGSQLVHEDLEQIHEDDLQEMDLKWQLALVSVRARKYYQRTGKKITINGSDTAGYDKSKGMQRS